MLDLHHKEHTPCRALSRTEEMHLHEKLRHFVNTGKVMWKTGKIIWIIEAKNANEVKESFTI